MKVLVERSIKISPGLNIKTVFDLHIIEDSDDNRLIKESENLNILKDPDFLNLTKMKGRRTIIEYEIEENNIRSKERLLIYLPRTDSQDDIINFITSEIKKHIN